MRLHSKSFFSAVATISILASLFSIRTLPARNDSPSLQICSYNGHEVPA